MDHPPDAHFALLLRGELPADETRALVAHLIHGCPTCAARLFPQEPPNYEGLLSAPETNPLRGDGPPPSILWLELSALPPPQRHLALQRRRFRTPALAIWLLRHSRERAPVDPEAALFASETALGVVDQLAFHSALAPDLLHNLRASALAHLGNSRRCLGLFPASLGAFSDAGHALARGAPDRLDRSDFLSLRSSLYKDIGRFDEAAADLRAAYRLARDLVAPHYLGRLLLKLADIVGLSNPSAGLQLLEAAEARLDFLREPRLELSLLHRRAWFLADQGKPSLALQVFRRAWPLYNSSLQPRVRGLRAWVWGRIERAFGDFEQAATYLSRAVALFRELGAAHDHAVSGLDLADVYLRLGQTEAARELLASSVAFLEDHLHPQGLERWLRLTRGILTPELLAEATRYFRRYWNVPSEPAA